MQLRLYVFVIFSKVFILSSMYKSLRQPSSLERWIMVLGSKIIVCNFFLKFVIYKFMSDVNL